jgi:threonine/homoserine/homoserine lactone efflux protein
MHTQIEYASPQTTARRWSKMAIVALGASLANPVFATGFLAAMRNNLVPDSENGELWLGIFAAITGTPAVLTFIAFAILCHRSTLKGMRLIVPASIASVVWPVYCVYWFFSNLPNC